MCLPSNKYERTGLPLRFRVLRDRELKRQLHVWERRCREEYTPLLEEWVPPTEKQTSMACSLGSARAMEEILTVRKARWVQAPYVRLKKAVYSIDC